MRTFVIDFETYYDQDYSLSKMNTEAYIRDPRFEALMVGVRELGTDFHTVMEEPEFRSWERTVDWSDAAICAHHTHFDGAILAWKYGIRPRLWLCTLSMARAVVGGYVKSFSLAALAEHFGLSAKGTFIVKTKGRRRADFSPGEWEEFKAYCSQDVRITAALYQILRQGMHTMWQAPAPFPTAELVTIDHTIRMFTEPVLQFDPFQMNESLAHVRRQKDEALRATGMADPSALMSNPKFAAALQALGVEPPRKTSPTTGLLTYAFAKSDVAFTELLEHPDPRVQALVSARLKHKSTLVETRTEAFLTMNARGACPVYLNYAGAHQTQRHSGGDSLNWQNTPRGGAIRHSIQAPPGHVIVAVDSANIEARVLDTLAGQWDVVEVYKNADAGLGPDVYCTTAEAFYGRAIIKDVDIVERQMGKVIKLGCIAEGELVLTDCGLVPIEKVTSSMRVWDGLEWVNHDGVIYQGINDVISYQGLRATADHVVFCDDGTTCAFAEAAENQRTLATTSYAAGSRSQKELAGAESVAGGTRVYDILNAGPRHRFTVSGVLVHNCGFGVGGEKFVSAARMLSGGKIVLTQEEADRAVKYYRARHQRVVALWRQCEDARDAMRRGAQIELGVGGILRTVQDGILRPSGLTIKYPNLRQIDQRNWAYRSGRYDTVNIYGGKIVENCLAAGTEVLTDRGWLAIEDVELSDKVHDGVEFVQHGGTVFKSVQPCVTVDGVFMTPDHEVLTDEGWKAASQNPKPYRPNLRGVDCGQSRAQQRSETVLAVSMHVRELLRKDGCRREEGSKARGDSELRVHDRYADRAEEPKAWHEQASGVCGVAVDAGPMQATDAPSVGKLRGPGYYRVRPLEGVVREFLGRHGGYVCSRARLGSYKQRRAIQSGKLRVGIKADERHEQTRNYTRGHTSLEQANRNTPINAVLPAPARPVFDIINAGPRQRFVVRGDSGAFIVHNCVQALARDIVMEQSKAVIRRLGAKWCRWVLSVHDEAVYIVPIAMVEEAKQACAEEFRKSPEWWPALPLNMEVGAHAYYGKC